MGYENPLLALPAAKLLLARPVQKRLVLSMLFRQVRTEANDKAVNAWARRQHQTAAFWRATSTYARHVSLLLSHDNPLKVKPSKLLLPPAAPVTLQYRYPLLNLAGTKAIFDAALEDRQLLALLFNDLSIASKLEAEKSWQKRKAPMAGYWTDCAKHARRLARLPDRPHALARAALAPASVSHLSVLLAACTGTELGSERCLAPA